MACSRPFLLLVFAAIVSHAAVEAFQKISEVPFTETDEKTGAFFVTTMTGKKWTIHRSEEHNMIFFTDEETQKSIWEDPRSLPLTAEERAKLPPEQLAAIEAEERKAAEQQAKQRGSAGKAGTAKGSSFTITLVAVVPVVLFAAGMIARIWYLHTYYPELLFPTKERKKRVRSGSKFKPQKQRGKLNQDGKGGRSNNT